jgi:hypothetical protein
LAVLQCRANHAPVEHRGELRHHRRQLRLHPMQFDEHLSHLVITQPRHVTLEQLPHPLTQQLDLFHTNQHISHIEHMYEVCP